MVAAMMGCKLALLACLQWCFIVLVCVRTQCVPSVATRVVAKIYRPIFLNKT